MALASPNTSSPVSPEQASPRPPLSSSARRASEPECEGPISPTRRPTGAPLPRGALGSEGDQLLVRTPFLGYNSACSLTPKMKSFSGQYLCSSKQETPLVSDRSQHKSSQGIPFKQSISSLNREITQTQSQKANDILSLFS